jgi:excisionase family DNA binding protein
MPNLLATSTTSGEQIVSDERQLGRLRDLPWLIEYTGLSKDTIYKLVKEGRIPVTRIDRRLRFDIVAIDKWINRHTF